MRIKQMMTGNPLTVGLDTLVLEAQRIMKEKNIQRLPLDRSPRQGRMVMGPS